MSNEFFLVKRGSTALPNKTVFDRDWSFQALALLLTTLALPPHAPMGYRAFLDMNRGMGRDTIQRALKELGTFGYRWQFKIRTSKGIRTATIISDERISEATAVDELVSQSGFEYIISCENTKTTYSGNSATKRAGQPVQQVSGAQKTSAQGCVLQVSGAQETGASSRREVNSSSLRSELNNQPTKTDQTQDLAEPRFGSG